jgi:hypothetical protein
LGRKLWQGLKDVLYLRTLRKQILHHDFFLKF